MPELMSKMEGILLGLLKKEKKNVFARFYNEAKI